MDNDKKNFDVFISFKSEDEKYARKVYDFLKHHGFMPFFSTLSVSYVGDSQYLKSIADAIDQCRHMIVVASEPEHIRSPWVEYEWGIFIARRNDRKTDGNLLTVLAGDMRIADLPNVLLPFQSLPLSDAGLQELLQYLGYQPDLTAAPPRRMHATPLWTFAVLFLALCLAVPAGLYLYEKILAPGPTPTPVPPTAQRPPQKDAAKARASAQTDIPAPVREASPAAVVKDTPAHDAMQAKAPQSQAPQPAASTQPQTPVPAPPETKAWTEPLTGMQFVWIPGDCYPMGNPLSKEHWRGDEGPVHEVCVNGFWMSKREVTREQFAKFVTATGYRTVAEKQGWSLTYNGKWKKVPNVTWKNPGFPQTDRHPVVHVAKVDAQAMLRWLSTSGSGTFHLPTEAQWEYACRGKSYVFRPWNDEAPQACQYANIYDRAGQGEIQYPWEPFPCDDHAVRTAPVAQYKANPFGLDDMLGNVWEWTDDRHGWYDPAKRDNPLATTGDGYVIRGGGWNSGQDMSCVRRENLGMDSIRADNLGLRLIRKAP
ncbi:MAG TPA: SUMF1/EgtB/PvdO family nonheme iron enzyme [Solidesulfovibrio sp.]|nr:SUMF1/EgtB/PvdO family nonheme iron enzyme [Solidesulfovibrio sp.]